uniref:Uncharacterized protein n=1 Tax=Arundo donax TaxID=35708 RepID=A0A0A8XYA9_ARUDO
MTLFFLLQLDFILLHQTWPLEQKRTELYFQRFHAFFLPTMWNKCSSFLIFLLGNKLC